MRKHTYTLARALVASSLDYIGKQSARIQSRFPSSMLWIKINVDATTHPHHTISAGIARNDLEEALATFAEWGGIEVVDCIMVSNESLSWVIQEIRMLHQQLKF
ncbi:hypothetical protein TorRG33x02_234350 [Trema orientale]|uniref:Uncharacterized protein n=1 Tax=Trema orientale TaxID=63057 RepID=A0A2P5E4G2_TREOI|nr:hypothetical protein TorRG33x02_234350 [Trema orientale]